MSEYVHAKAQTGEYVGKVLSNGVHEYLGIRYAKPPMRWKRAEALDPSDELIGAVDNPPAEWQHYMVEEFDFRPPMSEDCLFLNVWTSGKGENKPVYVFIHGGSFVEGSIRTECFGGIYCGDEFVATHPDVVYVNVEYRFGPFGSMDLSAWDPEGHYADSCNIQILDQTLALKWIKDNIAAFGGNPDDITVGGQSAGCMSVFTLMSIPESAQLFNKAICMSSAPTSGPLRTMKSKRDAQNNARIMAEQLGITSLSDWLAASPMSLVKATDEVFITPELVGGFEPCCDDCLVAVDIEGALSSGCASHISVMSGSVAGEYSDSMIDSSADEIEERIRGRYPIITDADIQAYKDNYPERDEKSAMEDMCNDMGLRLRQITASEAVMQGGSPLYMYYMAFQPKGARIRPQHCTELQYVSGKLDQDLYLNLASGETLLGKHPNHEFGKKVQDIWYNFIATGNPNGPTVDVEWPLYDAQDQLTYVMDEEPSVARGGARSKDVEIMRHYA